jgi:hypothetical protein
VAPARTLKVPDSVPPIRVSLPIPPPPILRVPESTMATPEMLKTVLLVLVAPLVPFLVKVPGLLKMPPLKSESFSARKVPVLLKVE